LPVSDITPKPAVSSPRITGYLGARVDVLVVDDVEGNRAVVMDFLGSLGFLAREADQGEAALKGIEAKRPDLVLMDILMPVMDGLTATQRLRAMPGCERLPVIVLSAGASEADRAKCLEVGADSFLVKPIDFDELLERIGELLRLRWVHEAPAPAAPADGVGGDEALIAPAPQDIEELYRLARIGNMRSIGQYAEGLAAQDARYLRFTQQICLLASRFQSRAIMEFISQYRDEGAAA
jgi:CheY-like chemotaxis protein